ncbi:MAG TPA: DUF1593 domain-containing protein [Bryobacteraceae bacterium]|nr:DUF1593 domain-containing protein [Bryobacteraceae bacterium]
MARRTVILFAAAVSLAFAAKPRLVVLTDIGGDPDDEQSMVRLMVHSNEFDVEGLIASASGTPGELKKNATRPDLIRRIVAKVHPNLLQHDRGFPLPSRLAEAIRSGKKYDARAMCNGEGRHTYGSRHIIAVVDRNDSRPVNIAVWGGPTDLAQALWRVRSTRSAEELRRFTAKLRVFAIGHQDDSGPWIMREFPDLFYVLASVDPADVLGHTYKGKDRRKYRQAPGN